MAKIHINNPKQVINGGAKKYYFKVKGLGGPKGDKGDKGDTGQTGPQGPQGNAATVSVGSTTTLPVGQDATVQNVGTLYNAVLNFGIPQGPRGPQGATGATGAKGDKGDQGNPGPQGERGTNATVYVGTTTTTNPGTQARVYNSGTDSNAVLNFEIPRGDVGPSVPLVQETGYSTTKAMSQNATTEALNGKQNTLTAGSNITISGNTISAKDTTYTAGDNVQINGTVISATDTTYTAGANIQIENGTISATDTTYTAGNGLNLNGTEFSADTTVLATKEDLEGYYTKPETDNLLAPKLEAEVVTELPTTGAEGKLYLTPKAHTTSTATGNPIEATITEQAGQLESFQLDGDTFQQTYTGQNLYNVAQVSTGTYVTKDDDGWITITRDNTSGSSTVYTNVWTGNLALETSTTYKIFIEVKAVSGAGSLFITSTNSTQGQFNSWQEKKLASMAAGQTYTVTPTTKSSFSGITQGLRTVLEQTAGQGCSVTFRLSVCASSTPTETFSYEPFVGGQPSPSPDYPQPIQTVTGTQTVEIVGKNQYPFNDTIWSSTQTSSQWCFQNGATNAYGADVTDRTYYKITLPAGIYTMTAFDISSNIINVQACANGESVETIVTSPFNINSDNPSSTITLTETTTLCVRYRITNPSLGIGNTKIQIELGSTASSFVPYSHQTLPLDLGDIELCKLGIYQDYIWKDGENWKVHKATSSTVFDGSSDEEWVRYTGGGGAYWGFYILKADTISGSPSVANILRNVPDSSPWAGGEYTYRVSSILNLCCALVAANDTLMSLAEWQTYLGANNLIVKLALATPTDTTITDTTLIAQLEAIRTASLQNGANTITNVATGSNLAGDMEIGYYGFNPTNRYDKFIWLDLNNNYEQIGGE